MRLGRLGAAGFVLYASAGCGDGSLADAQTRDGGTSDTCAPGAVCGEAGVPDARSDGDGPAPGACLETTFDLGDGGEWLSIWTTDDGKIHVAQETGTVAAAPDGGKVWHLAVAISSWDPKNRTWVGKHIIEFPPNLPDDAHSTSVASVVGSPDGHFAAYYWWNSSPGYVAIGRVESDEPPRVVQLVDDAFQQFEASAPMTWDGEAFALHDWQGSSGGTGLFGLQVARVAPDGRVLLPPTVFGHTSEVGTGVLGFHLSTDPTSGMTYVFDATVQAPNQYHMLSGHEREGTPLAGTEKMPKSVEPVGMVKMFSGSDPAVDATPNGAWVMWHQSDPIVDQRTIVQHLDRVGNADRPASQLSGPVDDPFPDNYAIVERSDGTPMTLWVGAYRVYFAEGEPFEPHVLVDYEVGPIPEKHAKDPKYIDARDFRAVETADGQVWVGFVEEPQAFVGNPNPAHYRLMRVAPGCVYPRMDLAPAP